MFAADDLVNRRTWPFPTVSMSLALLGFAYGMAFEPARWLATPAYGNLMEVMRPQWWGLAYFVASLTLVASLFLPRERAMVLLTHLWPVVLLLWWWIAFVVRWRTDDHTTVANTITWLLMLGLVVWSARLNDSPRHAT